ncbi:CatB-related O-acetyltransferase [Aliivibrio sifiae]|uniref:CatB-related O-acetyltransferase n=1 Tax=Aliivibrio sifiae TaxID=566293 RepID=UPI000CF4343B
MKIMLKNVVAKFIFRNNNIASYKGFSLFAKASNSSFKVGARLAPNADVRSSFIGRYSSIGRSSKLYRVKMGDFCSISWDVTINARNHNLSALTTSAFPYVKRMGFVEKDHIEYQWVNIGHDVWVGTGAIILPGVDIGTGAVIGAGSVVTKDVLPYDIVAGNPARVIRKRFSEDKVSELLQMKWWDWDDFKIKDNLEIFK